MTSIRRHHRPLHRSDHPDTIKLADHPRLYRLCHTHPQSRITYNPGDHTISDLDPRDPSYLVDIQITLASLRHSARDLQTHILRYRARAHPSAVRPKRATLAERGKSGVMQVEEASHRLVAGARRVVLAVSMPVLRRSAVHVQGESHRINL